MLTQCPNCQTIYQITASELSAAQAFVECGECGTQFNALERIADEPNFEHTEPDATTDSNRHDDAKSGDTVQTSDPQITLMPEPAVADHDELPEDEMLTLSVPDTDKQLDDTIQDEFIEPEIPPSEEPVREADDFDTTIELAKLGEGETDTNTVSASTEAAHESTPPDHEILFTAPGSEDASKSGAETPDPPLVNTDDIDIDEVPPILQEELLALQEAKKPRAPWYWSVMALLLFAGLCTQGAWRMRDQILAQFPELRQPAMLICEKLGCVIEDPEKFEPIQLVSRDVRTHPRYENALLVNASMVNASAETIEFPTVQLGLFDNTGTAIGIRQFAPQEYLDRSIDIPAGIPPGRSVHVVMELANAGDRATSFEFSFY